MIPTQIPEISQPLATSSAVPEITPIIVNVINGSQNTPTDYAAWFGAIIALLLLCWEIYKYMNDCPKIKITIDFEKEILGQTTDGRMENLSKGDTFWCIDVVNSGTKEIVINQISVIYKINKGKKGAIITKDYNGPINSFRLTPHGKNRTIVLAYNLVHPANIKTVEIKDTTGKTYNKKVHYNKQ